MAGQSGLSRSSGLLRSGLPDGTEGCSRDPDNFDAPLAPDVLTDFDEVAPRHARLAVVELRARTVGAAWIMRQIEDPRNDVFLSAASVWEIAIKRRLGKLALPNQSGHTLPGASRAIR